MRSPIFLPDNIPSMFNLSTRSQRNSMSHIMFPYLCYVYRADRYIDFYIHPAKYGGSIRYTCPLLVHLGVEYIEKQTGIKSNYLDMHTKRISPFHY